MHIYIRPEIVFVQFQNVAEKISAFQEQKIKKFKMRS
jgi:hypothetical protein